MARTLSVARSSPKLSIFVVKLIAPASWIVDSKVMMVRKARMFSLRGVFEPGSLGTFKESDKQGVCSMSEAEAELDVVALCPNFRRVNILLDISCVKSLRNGIKMGGDANKKESSY